MRSKFLAIGSTLLLVAGLFTLGTSAASAGSSGNPNSAEYWQNLYPNAVACYKYSSDGGAHGTVTNGGKAVTLNTFQQSWPGDRWEVLIVNGGAEDVGYGNGNKVYELPVAGTAYYPPLNGGGQQPNVSHWIVCKGQTPSTPADATAAIGFTAPTCDTAQGLVLKSIENATWGDIVYSGPDNLSFSVTATATDGHKFSDGKSTKTFTGTLLPPTGDCTPPPCLDSSAVSYTYEATTNSGVITVAAKDGHSTTLCNPFWVTAASWTFDGNTMWPQTLDQWNPANSGQKIDSVGTYAYGANVDCGQGDIYATFNNPGVPYPTAGILNGPSDPYAEHFLHQMGFSGPYPTWTVQNAGSCNPDVVETVPGVTFTDVCGTANDGYTAVADTAEIDYTVTDERVDGVGTVTVTAKAKAGYVFADGAYTGPWTHAFTDELCTTEVETVPAVTFTDLCGIANDGYTGGVDTSQIDYTITDARVDGVGLVTVTAVPKTGFVFADGAYTGPWTHEFTNESCGEIAFIEPFAVDPTCPQEPNATSGYIQLDQKEHLHYAIDGVPTSLVKNDRAPGTYTISVTVDDGYTLIGDSSWPITVNPPFCPPTHALLSTTASMVDITCSTPGTYTLADTPGVQWFVNGSTTPTPAGTYQVATASTVNVKAELVDPVADGWEDGVQTEWSFGFTNPDDCLPTLAFTGSSGGNVGLLLAGGLLLFGGTIIALERRFRFGAR